MAGSAEGFVARLANVAHALGGFLEELARIEVGLVFRQVLADRAGKEPSRFIDELGDDARQPEKPSTADAKASNRLAALKAMLG